MEQSTRAPLLKMGKVGWVGDGFHDAPMHLAQAKCLAASGAWGSHGPRLELHGHCVPARGPYRIPSLLKPQSGFQGLLGLGGTCKHFRPISGWRVLAWEEEPFLSIASWATRMRKACQSPDKCLYDLLPMRTNRWALGSLLWGQTCLLTGFGLSSPSSTDDSTPGSSYRLSLKLLPLLKHLSSTFS